ncbi:hypothetical protein [Nostoc sp. C117]|uniref:hypothetical protein n=1 Tax=Nostoc sp. C117 TaxID=3349875 RepID=UPI00370D57A2
MPNHWGYCHIAVNLLTQEKRVKCVIKNKQFLAAMDNKYLLSILALVVCQANFAWFDRFW